MTDNKLKAPERTVLITGCSDGGLGAALAVAFHEADFRVYATARNVSKMAHLSSLGIETLTLDVQSDDSIIACVKKVPALDILVNNAGAGYGMPISDLSISEAKKLFDLNVWSYLAVTKAFLPLLIQSKGMIVNHTSSASVVAVPFQSVYNASKAAMAMFSDTERLELSPFDIRVVDLKTGVVKSNFLEKLKQGDEATTSLPEGSIYAPAREAVEKHLRGGEFDKQGGDAQQWAKSVVRDLVKKQPPKQVWRGPQAGMAWLTSIMPLGTFDGLVKRMTGVDVVERTLRK